MVEDANSCFSKDYCPSYNTTSKIQSQDSNNKDFSCIKKPKTMDLKPVLPYIKLTEILEQVKKNQKKKFHIKKNRKMKLG